MAADWTLVFPIIVGSLITFQGVSGAKLASHSSGPGFANFAIFFTSFLAALLGFLIQEKGGTTVDYAAGFAATPWFGYIGGLLGPWIVFTIIALIPRLGASLFFVVQVCAQILGALAIDTFGILGVSQRNPSAGAIVGLTIAIVSVIAFGVAKDDMQPHTPETSEDEIAQSTSSDTDNSKLEIVSLEVVENETSATTPRFSFALFALFILFAAISGVLNDFQAALNSTVAKGYNSSAFGALLSTIASQFPCAIVFALEYRKTRVSIAKVFKEAPWWTWFGGVISYGIIIMFTYLTDRLGTAVMMGAILSAQVVTSMIADSFGLWGLKVKKASWLKIAAAFFLLAGVIILTVFRS
ncbi:hypothetical protein BC830DRAFT_804006 [Chytriomyces sp. MP71]|nr:hypothetical protein BC830DRAFT_804006 [Chytriomyces sp. MP71]